MARKFFLCLSAANDVPVVNNVAFAAERFVIVVGKSFFSAEGFPAGRYIIGFHESVKSVPEHDDS